MKKQRIGLIDVGSNTVRLVIFEINEYFSINEIQNIKSPARLVQYLNEEYIMSEEGIQKLLSIIKSFREIAIRYDIEALLAFATAAIRQSTNAKEIIKKVTIETDIALHILSEKEEAFFGNYAVRHTMGIKDGISIDIGGGSTELTLFKNKQVTHSHSFPFGVVTLKEQFFSDSTQATEKSIKKAVKFIKDNLKKLDWLHDIAVPIIGIGGSARNIAEIYQRKYNYPIAGVHQYEMSKKSLNETVDLLKSLPPKERGDLDGLSKDREDIIVPAALVFQSLMDRVDSPTFIISNRGLREGLLMEYLNKEFNNPFGLTTIKQQTIERLARQYGIQPLGARQRIAITDKLLTTLESQKLLSYPNSWTKLIHFGSYLYFLGSFIEDDSKSQHTFYVISNSNLHGFSHKERVMLSLLASYKNKSLFEQYLNSFEGWFTEEEEMYLLHLGSIIKFSEALNDSHVNVVKDIQLTKTEKGYLMSITYLGDILAEEYRANKQKNHLERLLNKPLDIEFNETYNPNNEQ